MANTTVVIENSPTTVVLNAAVPSVIVSATQGPPGNTGDLLEGSFDSSRVNITSLGLQTLDWFPYTQFGAAKYIIYATFGLERQICEILLIQDGTTVQMVEYANMITTSLLGTFSANITNGFVYVIVDPTTVGASFKIIRTLINN